MPRIYTTLSDLPRFQSGIGDGDALRVRIREDLQGGWFPEVRTGYYYIGTEERYRYSDERSLAFPAASGTLTTRATSGLTEDPTRLGPIRLVRSGRVRPLARTCSPLRAFRALTVQGTGTLRHANVAGSGALISIVTHPVTGLLTSVPTTGAFISNMEYCYRPDLGLIYLPEGVSETLWATFLVGDTDPHLLRQEEIVRIDRDGKARTRLAPVCMAAGLAPLLRKPSPAGMTQITATAATGNVVSFAASGLITSGDIVAIQYYVVDTFTAVLSGDRLAVTVLPGVSGLHTLSYEQGLSGWYDTSQLASGTANYIQLNPLLAARESGFLYLADPDDPWPAPVRLRFELAHPTPLYRTDTTLPTHLTVTVLDAENEPLPDQPLTVTATMGGSPSGTLTLRHPLTMRTDGRGQLLFRYTPAATGIVTLTAQVTGTAASGAFAFTVRDAGFYERSEELRLGKLFLHLEEAPTRGELYRLNACHVYADGVPYQPPDNTEHHYGAITFRSTKSRFYDLDGQLLERPAARPVDPDGVASVLVELIPGDVFRAEAQTGTTGRIRTTAPVRIPAGVEHVGNA